MGFWIFMLIIDLLIPVIMIAVGKSFLKAAPKNINPVFGYRTPMSMKNRESWKFAHNFCGKIWLRVGLILLSVSVIPMIFVIGGTERVIGGVGLVISLLGVITIILSILPTEIALKRNFDKDGNKKNNELSYMLNGGRKNLPPLCYGFSQLRTERPKHTTTRYAGARRLLYKKFPQVVQ